MTNNFLIVPAVVMALLWPNACQKKMGDRGADGNVTTLVGTLQGGMAAVGGETTGWILVADGRTNPIEIDVSEVLHDARRNDGRRVSVSGTFIERRYVERGPVRILLAHSITSAGGK